METVFSLLEARTLFLTTLLHELHASKDEVQFHTDITSLICTSLNSSFSYQCHQRAQNKCDV